MSALEVKLCLLRLKLISAVDVLNGIQPSSTNHNIRVSKSFINDCITEMEILLSQLKV